MSKDKTQDDYEVGYRKPPKDTRFQKGVSGNPTGRPKKATDFHSIFRKESGSLITVNDNGQRRRISKLEGIAKQLHNKALTGNIPALRMYFALYPQVLEIVALQSENLEKKYASQYTDEELEEMLDDLKKETRKGHVSNAD